MISRRALGLGAAGLALAPFAAASSLPLPAWEGQVLQPVSLFRSGPQPKCVRFAPDGKSLWAAFLDGPPSVGAYRVPDGAPLGEPVTLGEHGAVELLFSSDGSRLWASQMETARVYEIDPVAGKELRVFQTGSNWSKVVVRSHDGARLFVSNWNFNDVSEIDLATGKLLRRLPTVTTPRGLFPTSDGRWLYVGGFGDGNLERIELATGKRHVVFDGGRALRHVVGDERRDALYLTDMGARAVWRTSLKTGRTTRFARTDANPNGAALSPDGTLLFVSNRGPNGKAGYLADGPAWGSVLVIDTADGAVLDSIIGGNQCTGIDVSPDGALLAFSDFRDDTIRLYRVPDHATLKAAGWPRREVHAKELWK